MNTEIHVQGDQNVILVNSNSNTLTLRIGEELHEIRADLVELKTFLQTHQKPLQIGEQIYNIEQINEAIFQNQTHINTQNVFLPTSNTPPTKYEAFLQDIRSLTHNQNTDSRQPIAGKTTEALSPKALRKLFARPLVKKHFQRHKIGKTADNAQKLKALDLMTNGFVIKGTFLCLAEMTQIRSVSQNADTAKFFVFRDREGLRTSINEFVQGNLIEQFEQMIQHLQNTLYIVRNQSTRTDDYEIPEEVFKELVANAFVHRDYAGKHINTEVRLFPDRVEIINAGKFPEGFDLQNPFADIVSEVINQDCKELFRR